MKRALICSIWWTASGISLAIGCILLPSSVAGVFISMAGILWYQALQLTASAVGPGKGW